MQKEECGSFFSFIPLGMVLSGYARLSTNNFLPLKVHRVHECLRFAVGESFWQQQLFRLYSAVRQKEQHVAIFLIDRVNIYNNFVSLGT